MIEIGIKHKIPYLYVPMDYSLIYVFFLFQGVKHFDFIPESYIIPEEFNEFNGKCFCHVAGLHWVGFVVLMFLVCIFCTI